MKTRKSSEEDRLPSLFDNLTEGESLPEETRMTEEELVEKITYHNRKYWEEGQPEISDEEYDRLVRDLSLLNPQHPLLQQIQAPSVASAGKVPHDPPMLSLDKAYSLGEVLSWCAKTVRSPQEKLLVQPKYDGISAGWDGMVLSTRGDGYVGEDITDKTPLLELEHPLGTCALKGCRHSARGEIVIREDDFQSLYSHIRNRNGRLYKNSRNAVAGLMGLKEIGDMVAQGAKLTLVDYGLHSWETTAGELSERWEELVQAIEALPYPMDGIVIKLADTEYADSLGNTAHHPRGAIAFKFSGVRQNSVLLDVEWSFGKNCLTPVAIIRPVDINGTTIRRASLHNLQNIVDRDIQIGDDVVVERAGDVIPYIVSSSPGEVRRRAVIDTCPCCGSHLVQDPPELRCVNPECGETLLQRLLAAVKNIGIERLGEPNLRKMMQVLQVRHLQDIFRLRKEDILRLDGFAGLSADNLIAEIQKARQVPDWQVLASLNIKGIGPNIAKAILNVHTLEELRGLDEAHLALLDGIGPERARELSRELRQQKEQLQELLSCVDITQTKGGSMERGMPTVCFTGKMPEKRSFYQNLAKEHGMVPVDDVTSSLALLVAMDPNENSSKLKKARKNGIPIQSLDEWMNSFR